MDKAIRKNILKKYSLNIVLLLLGFILIQSLIVTGVLNSYAKQMIILVFINMILTLSLNMATGFLGELCLGHAGFMAIGAYTAAIFTKNMPMLPPGLAFFIGILLGMIMSGVFGFLIGVPAFRLEGDYLAIITLAFGQIISIFIRSLPFTGGALGLSGIKRMTNFPWVYGAFVFTLVFIICLMFSGHGRAILSVREDSIAASSSGVNVVKYKVITFVFSAMLAGLAGALYAHFQGNLVPTKFDYNYSIDIMVMVVFGGMGSMTGSILAAIILTLVPALLQGLAQYRMLLYALMLILMMIFRPDGVFGRKELTYDWIRQTYRKIRGRWKEDA